MSDEAPASPPARELPFTLAAGLLGVAITFSLFYGTSFFRDMAIVFEGGFRIAEGQVPFHDFYVPGGLAAFYMQALSILIFGATALSMPAHAGALAAIVAMMTYPLARESFGRPLALVVSGFMVMSLNGIFGNPGYSFVGYFFFDVLCLLLLRRLDATAASPRFMLALALLTALAILGKQDLLLSVPLLALYLWLSGMASWRQVGLSYLVPVAVLLALVAAIFQTQGDFLYWFNYGQAPHHSRLALTPAFVAHVAADWRFWLSIAALVVVVLSRAPPGRQRSSLLALVLIAGVPIIVVQTSGLSEQTRLQGIPLLAVLLYRLAMECEGLVRWRERRALPRRALERLAKAAAVLALLVFVPPIALLVSIDVNLAQHFSRPSLSGVGNGDARIREGAYRGVLVRQAAARDLVRIRELVRARGGSFIALTSYGFIYADFDQAPPTRLPLWFDHGISFFDAQITDLTEGVVARRAEVLLVQDAHDHFDRSMHDRVVEYFLGHGYERVMRAEAPRTDRPIEVLARKR